VGTFSFTSPATVYNHHAGPGILPALTALETPCTSKPIRLGIQQCVERLLDRFTYPRAEMIRYAGLVVNLDAYRL
jgi:hypothetical protein